ncbi:MAG: DNA topoisomerase I [Elusimicrobia bacterium RIFOXYB12_FULL_50_12]|nr:MAG: DNA topoisomerase I [Elusimicrobia bacterium RIFOXYA12_FULL_49_49]OGS16653.1 MAG: DNA topoisomerase I [Elusimicrobia bacterium RIFOXYA2_FULL_47_53]OGS25502.1 MAG: DNA topoisomerase I [Elusimicrobia bacterium RIFOXYB12_FULL_50_12]OGS31631.1 MAG: DNA topoisomerase I [Elusimicrobia bacterium RIFOXYB2_FULL_46_23]
MAKYLVIVESPTKEKTISRFLGPEYTVKSSYGHIRDLPKSKIGVDPENNFEPEYVIMPKAKKIIPELKKLTAGSKYVYLATDYDREGEAIAWHLKEALKLPASKVKRITFHEITAEAIKEAVENPRDIDPHLVDAQQARRVLDRLVGYKLSPLLWKKIKYGLSAGRVQSVAVRLICDREKEIDAFNPVEYWSVKAELKKSPDEPFLASLIAKDGKKIDKLDIRDSAAAEKTVAELSGAKYRVASVESKERQRAPFAPYTTSTLQQDASRRLHFSAAKTMMIAQKLYEGIELGDKGNAGLITYMRTDSLNISEQARKEAKKLIVSKYGADYYPEKPRIYKTKSKGAQEAHEAIRPASCRLVPQEIKQYLSPDEFKLYDLIWSRFMASQMVNAVYDTLSVDIAANNYTFRATGRTLKFSGFLEVYSVADSEDEQEDGEGRLPKMSVGDILDFIKLHSEQHFTEPPPRFNEASLIKALEEHGIGRPSTYAPTIHTIIDRGYVRLETRKFFPTDMGKLVNDVLQKNFSQIVDVEFTARVEGELDKVAEGESVWTDVVSRFYTPFNKDLADAEKNLARQKVEPQKSDEVCPKCGKPMVIRESRRGRFLACTGFPECRTTFSIDRNNQKIIKPAPEQTGLVCEKCGKPMLKRFGKRGAFLACSGFPKCRNTKKLPENE